MVAYRAALVKRQTPERPFFRCKKYRFGALDFLLQRRYNVPDN